MNHTISEATIFTLTAEVKTLMVGSRQVTLSVYRQLDACHYDLLEPMGRVNVEESESEMWVVGRHRKTGALARASLSKGRLRLFPYEARDEAKRYWKQVEDEYEKLPLIILAGLK